MYWQEFLVYIYLCRYIRSYNEERLTLPLSSFLRFEVSPCMATAQKIHEYYMHDSFYRGPLL